VSARVGGKTVGRWSASRTTRIDAPSAFTPLLPFPPVPKILLPTTASSFSVPNFHRKRRNHDDEQLARRPAGVGTPMPQESILACVRLFRRYGRCLQLTSWLTRSRRVGPLSCASKGTQPPTIVGERERESRETERGTGVVGSSGKEEAVVSVGGNRARRVDADTTAP
jgi:hypothetical protein